MRCLFCETLLPSTKPEHVIQASIGGKHESRKIICDVHNEEFGRTSDKSFADNHQSLGNLIAIKTGRGKSAPTLSYANSPDGENYRLKPGGHVVQATARTREVRLDPGTVQLSVEADRARPDQLMAALEGILRKHGKVLGDLRSNTTKLSVSQSPAPIQVDFRPFAIGTLRAVARSSLQVLTKQVGTEAVRAAGFAALADFITGKRDDSVSFCRSDEVFPSSEIAGLHSSGPPVHRFIVSARREIGAEALVELFGAVRYRIWLSSTWPADDTTVGHSIDPVASEHNETTGFEHPPLTKKAFDSLVYDEDRCRTRFASFFAYAGRRRDELEVRRLIKFTATELGVAEGEDFTAEQLDELKRRVIEAVIASKASESVTREVPLVSLGLVGGEEE